MRLNRYLAQCGLGSRRTMDIWVEEGRVSVNGMVASLGINLNETDKVEVDGKPVSPKPEYTYILFNKPSGLLCSRGDTHGRPTVYDVLPQEFNGLHYVGRLDKESRGLLFFTNDGEFTEHLTHPRHAVLRLYLVKVNLDLTAEDIRCLRRGVEVEPGVVFQCASLETISGGYRLGLKEGKKREIRRLLAAVGRRVVDLKRIAFGGVELGELPEGKFRPLSTEEVEKLRRATAMESRLPSTLPSTGKHRPATRQL